MRSLTLLLLFVFALTARADFTPTSAFTDNGDGTVTHQLTGLTWMRCSMGQTWTGSTCSGTASTYTWDQAKALTSSFAGKSDWRLPSPWELATIVDYDIAYPGPTINTAIFPNTPSSGFWSGSPRAGSSDFAWGVYFSYGYAYYFYGRSYDSHVRLVRGGQSSALLNGGSASTTQSDCIFSWAERTYPELFSPANALSKSFPPYYYRYYSTTNSYLGTMDNASDLFYLGMLSQHALLNVGALSTWATTAGCGSF